mgnify:FL=1
MKTLDLHGTSHINAETLVESFFYNNEFPVKIVTGKSEKMHKIVLDIIDRYGYDYHYERLVNQGCLVITDKHI